MADNGYMLSESAARRTSETVRRVLNDGSVSAFTEPGTMAFHRNTLYLCKASSYIQYGTSGTVTIYHGTTKGSETSTSRTVSAYARYHSIPASQWCEAYEIDGQVNVWLPPQNRIGKTDAAHNKGATGTISVWAGSTQGSESDTGDNLTAYNRFGNVASGKWVKIVLEENGWEIIAAEC